MQSGHITRDGLLGFDKRSIEEIIRADAETVKKFGLTHRQIAERMKFFRNEGKKGLGGFVKVNPYFEVSCDMARGLLTCPFGEPGMYRKTMITVRNLRLGMEIAYSDLNIHLVAEHGFYEGKGSLFRLEPVLLANVLEINCT